MPPPSRRREVSVAATTTEGFIDDARAMHGYPDDVHTFVEAQGQVEVLSDTRPALLIAAILCAFRQRPPDTSRQSPFEKIVQSKPGKAFARDRDLIIIK